MGGNSSVVETDDRQVLRHGKIAASRRMQRARGHFVIAGEYRCGAGFTIEKAFGSGEPRFECVHACLYSIWSYRQSMFRY